MGLCDSKGNEIMYWRKANQFHNWFIENYNNGVDNNDGKQIKVTYKQVEEFLEVIRKVLESKEIAEEVLPTIRGFFFGDTEYNEYYFEDLEETFKDLTEKLKGYSKNEVFHYWSSW